MHVVGGVCARAGGNSYHPVPYRYNSLDPAHLMHTPGNWYLPSGQQSEYTLLCGSNETQGSKRKAVSSVIEQPFLSHSVARKTEVTTNLTNSDRNVPPHSDRRRCTFNAVASEIIKLNT